MKAAHKIEADLCIGILLRNYLEVRCPQSQPRVFELHGRAGQWAICVLKKDTRFYETQKGVYSPQGEKHETIDSYCELVLSMAGYEKKDLGNGKIYYG